MKFLENLNKYWATPIIAIITGVLGIYASVINNKIELQSAHIAEIETQLRQKEYTNEVRLHAYSEVKEAITNKDKKLQDAALLIINVLLEDQDSVFKGKLIDLMRYSPNTTDSVRKEIQRIDTFYTQQIRKPNHVFTIDVFYLETINKEALSGAKKVEELLAASLPDYNIRLRLLPRSINARNGYQIGANEIRYEKEEESIARKCLDLITSKNIFRTEQPRMHEIKYRTPDYISVFVKNL